jgi:hypothetical protein
LAWLGLAWLGLARLGSARLGSARLGSARLISVDASINSFDSLYDVLDVRLRLADILVDIAWPSC